MAWAHSVFTLGIHLGIFFGERTFPTSTSTSIQVLVIHARTAILSKIKSWLKLPLIETILALISNSYLRLNDCPGEGENKVLIQDVRSMLPINKLYPYFPHINHYPSSLQYSCLSLSPQHLSLPKLNPLSWIKSSINEQIHTLNRLVS